ncbi:MAG: HAMP domain-containing histidine kinase, partial [Lachnospiraceae bacterium]|nr:HAMP domain-containing histidine kinase [Lachnospiraceae bacterium]
IRGQLETDGEFDGKKQIDITRYANRKGAYNDCPITAHYMLDDLIKWGIYGVTYNQRTMSMSDFINYFSEFDYQYTDPIYFGMDENEQLYFRGFDALERASEGADDENIFDKDFFDTISMGEDWWRVYENYDLEDLEYIIFAYIVDQIPESISMSREEDGILNVYVDMLNCKYGTATGGRQLIDCADNWVDYLKLQRNLVDTIESLKVNYREYQESEALYQENNSNLKYMIRMNMEDGIHTFTNVSELAKQSESEITEAFSDYQKYFVYYPNSLEFTGNTSLSEREVAEYLKEYEYAYPENTHIWVGVDTNYPVVGDDFYNANAVFQKIVPHANHIVSTILFFLLIWLTLGCYLTVTAGVGFYEDGTKGIYLNPIDHIWTELMVLLVILLVYVGYVGFDILVDEAQIVYRNHSEITGVGMDRLLKYVSFGGYGFVMSMFINLFWYSLVRRVKSANLWKDSLIHKVLHGMKRGIRYILTHSNTAVNTLLPYNMYLLLNLISIVVMYLLRYREIFVIVIMVLLVIFDGLVGMMLFKSSAERRNIVEGISRIRDGEVDFRVDLENLHGVNRDMADAVNNIGEGIRKAVRTSVKNEQMKTDLITNVSHDIKTPLTSIINYVGLLKGLKIVEEPARSYIEVLDGKSQRLKQLTDDLVEASKLSSGNITFEREALNVTELLYQSVGEFTDRLEEKGLKLVFDGGAQSAYIYADSRRMWRVIENLFNNIYKYALQNTRVYLDLDIKQNGTTSFIEMSFKNISERQMNIKADDLTERFIRGDSSRATEGSGLGLYIAKNLIEGQGGDFEIYLDGDLFKVVIRFPEYLTEEKATEEPTEESREGSTEGSREARTEVLEETNEETGDAIKEEISTNSTARTGYDD